MFFYTGAIPSIVEYSMIFRQIRAIIMAYKKTYYSLQGDKFYNLTDNDKIVIAQPDTSGLKGFRTVTTNLGTVAQTVFEAIKNAGGLIYSDGQGIIGNGTTTDPLRVNMDYLRRKWVFGGVANISQVGDAGGGQLPMAMVDAWVIRNYNPIPVFLAGRNLTFPAQDIDVRDLASVTVDGYIYLYFRVINGELRIIGRNAPIADQYGTAYIGRARVSVAVGGINELITYTFVRIGTYRISTTPQGGAIPATGLSPYDIAYTWWGGPGSMILINGGFRTNWRRDGAVWDAVQNQMVITDYGSFYIENLQLTIDNLGNFRRMYVNSNTAGGRCYINGQSVWDGPGSNSTPVDVNAYLVEGWNTVKCEWGSMRIAGPTYK